MNLIPRCMMIALFLAGYLSACVPQGAKTSSGSDTTGKEPRKTMMEPNPFSQVQLNTFGRTICSPPEPENSWRGVAIQAPQSVTFKKGVRVGETHAFAAIPICGLYVLDVPFPIVEEVIELVAENRSTGRRYSGPIVDLDASPNVPPPQPPPLSKEDVEGMATGRYFNPNLADFVNIPELPGIYDVFVEVRGNRSNVVRIEILEESLK